MAQAVGPVYPLQGYAALPSAMWLHSSSLGPAHPGSLLILFPAWVSSGRRPLCAGTEAGREHDVGNASTCTQGMGGPSLPWVYARAGRAARPLRPGKGQGDRCHGGSNEKTPNPAVLVSMGSRGPMLQEATFSEEGLDEVSPAVWGFKGSRAPFSGEARNLLFSKSFPGV